MIIHWIRCLGWSCLFAPGLLLSQDLTQAPPLDDPTILIDDLEPQLREQVEKRTAELIRQLGHDSYSTRRNAQSELARIGMLAFEQLREAMLNDDPQIASSAHFLLQSIQQEWAWESDSLEVKEVLSGYAAASEVDRTNRIDRLARLNSDAAIGALCRICRYETHEFVSRYSAISILRCRVPSVAETTTPDPIGLNEDSVSAHSRADMIRVSIGKSHRTACVWLRLYSEGLLTQEFASDRWVELTREEHRQLLDRKETTRENVLKLYRWVCKQLVEHDERSKASALADSMLEILPSTSVDLMEVCTWALASDMPELVERLASQRTEIFNHNTKLRYALAESHARRNDLAKANSIAEEALHRGQPRDQRLQSRFNERCDVANLLKSRGLHDWAEQEYQAAIQDADPLQRATINIYLEYSTLLSEGKKYGQAAKVWEPFAKRLESEPLYRNQIDSTYIEISDGQASNLFIERYYYFAAMNAKEHGNASEAKAMLEQAAKAFEKDSDIWIELYRLSDDSNERERIYARTIPLQESLRSQIEQAEASIHEGNIDRAASDRQEQARALNELAWLLANTQGDLNEALRYSLRATEISEANSSYLDTLARVYFRLGKIDEAIRYQSMALDIEPHSQQLQRVLEEYRQAAG